MIVVGMHASGPITVVVGCWAGPTIIWGPYYYMGPYYSMGVGNSPPLLEWACYVWNESL